MSRAGHVVMALVASIVTFGCAPSAPTTVTPAPPAIAAPTPKPAPTPTPKPPFSFAGKTVIIVVPFTPGGAADIMARQMVPFMAKHMPGNPTVVINNMPGGAGLVGDNWVYNVAPKDGTVIGQPSTIFANAVFASDKAKYEVGKLRWLGGVADTSVLFAHAKLGIKSADELPKVTERLYFGDSEAGQQRAMPILLFLKLLGVDHKFVAGYHSSGDVRAAIRRAEINLGTDSLPGYYAAVKPMIAEGIVVPLAHAGIIQEGKNVRDPRLAEVPTYTELLVKLKGEAIKQTPEYRGLAMMASIHGLVRGWVYPPGVPQEVVAAAAEAFDKMLKDPEMLAEFEKSIGYKPITLNAAEAQKVANAIAEGLAKDVEALELMRRIAKEAG